MKKNVRLLVFALLFNVTAFAADSPRETVDLNSSWRFALGYAFDLDRDYDAADLDTGGWSEINLPHDWSTTVPFVSDTGAAKQLGWKYPQYSVGWYCKNIDIPVSDKGKRFLLQFEDISGNWKLFCNGYLTGKDSEGAGQCDITEYLRFGQSNVISIRIDVSGSDEAVSAGITGNVFLVKTGATAISSIRLKRIDFASDWSSCTLSSTVEDNGFGGNEDILVAQSLLDAQGQSVATSFSSLSQNEFSIEVRNPVLWSTDNPYLYTLRTCFYKTNYTIENLLDEYDITVGIRSLASQKGSFLLNGRQFEIKGCAVDPYYADLGKAVTTDLWKTLLEEIKGLGINSLVETGSPLTKSMLDVCDEMGFIVFRKAGLPGNSVFANNCSVSGYYLPETTNFPGLDAEAIRSRIAGYLSAVDPSGIIVEKSDFGSIFNAFSTICDNGSSSILDAYGNVTETGYSLKAVWTDEPFVTAIDKGSEIIIFSNCKEISISQGFLANEKIPMPSDGRLTYNQKNPGKNCTIYGIVDGKKTVEIVHSQEESAH